MADTKEFDVVRIARSDGADTGPGYWPTTASTAKKATKDAAPEKAPRAKPQMTRLPEDDPRYVEWRVKLGMLLKQELAPAPDGKTTEHLKQHRWPLTYAIRGKRVVCSVSTRVLAVREIQASMGLWISHQGQALQEPAGVCRPHHLAPLVITRVQRLLLRTLQ